MIRISQAAVGCRAQTRIALMASDSQIKNKTNRTHQLPPIHRNKSPSYICTDSYHLLNIIWIQTCVWCNSISETIVEQWNPFSHHNTGTGSADTWPLTYSLPAKRKSWAQQTVQRFSATRCCKIPAFYSCQSKEWLRFSKSWDKVVVYKECA